jgi:hypothetical protein
VAEERRRRGREPKELRLSWRKRIWWMVLMNLEGYLG